MNQCRATTAKGERCENAAHGSQDVCWSHDPKNAEKRRRMASKGLREASEGSSMGAWERTAHTLTAVVGVLTGLQ
jgi:hypothetical protein